MREVRAVWPEGLPLSVRISATDWLEGGWSLEESIELSRRLKDLAVDLIDCSSGGLLAEAKIRSQTGILASAVGFITEPHQANSVIESGQADLVLLGRELLRNPIGPCMPPRSWGSQLKFQSPICGGFSRHLFAILLY